MPLYCPQPSDNGVITTESMNQLMEQLGEDLPSSEQLVDIINCINPGAEVVSKEVRYMRLLLLRIRAIPG